MKNQYQASCSCFALLCFAHAHKYNYVVIEILGKKKEKVVPCKYERILNKYKVNIHMTKYVGSRSCGRQSTSSRNLPYLLRIAITNTNTKIRIRLITFLADLKVFMCNYDHT